jgi:hypothetical protein
MNTELLEHESFHDTFSAQLIELFVYNNNFIDNMIAYFNSLCFTSAL